MELRFVIKDEGLSYHILDWLKMRNNDEGPLDFKMVAMETDSSPPPDSLYLKYMKEGNTLRMIILTLYIVMGEERSCLNHSK